MEAALHIPPARPSCLLVGTGGSPGDWIFFVSRVVTLRAGVGAQGAGRAGALLAPC